jgi:hypothetical protein
LSSRGLISRAALLFACLAIATVVLGLYGDSLNVDASTFLLVGRGWVAGTAPYSGLWDHKPPAIYVLTAVVSLIDRHGDGVLAMRALSIGCVVATALTVDRIVLRLTGRIEAGVAAALLTSAVLASPMLSEGGGLTELFATPGMAIALLGVLRSSAGSKWAAIMAGAGLGWALSCSLLSVGMLPALAYAWLSIAPDGTGGAGPSLAERLKPRSLFWLVLGGVMVSAACWVPLIVSGSFGAALDAVVGYSALYRSLADFQPALWLVWLLILSPFWAPGVVAMALIRQDDHRQLTRIAAIWVTGGLCWLIYGERLFPHYLLVLTVPAVMLAVSGALRCRNLALPRMRRLASVAYVAFVLIGVTGVVANGPPNNGPEVTTNRSVAAYIDEHTAPSDGIYVWGISSDIYLSADRMPRGRYAYLLPLVTPGFGGSAAHEMLATWSGDPPILIVDASFGTAGHDALAPLLVDHPITPGDGRTASSTLDELRAFVRDRYELAVVIGDKRIYRLRS